MIDLLALTERRITFFLWNKFGSQLKIKKSLDPETPTVSKRQSDAAHLALHSRSPPTSRGDQTCLLGSWFRVHLCCKTEWASRKCWKTWATEVQSESRPAECLCGWSDWAELHTWGSGILSFFGCGCLCRSLRAVSSRTVCESFPVTMHKND